MIRASIAGLLLFALFAIPVAVAQETFCPPGESPRYVFGFADLKAQIGEAMGEPLTCEFPDPNGTGDVHQRTTTGLAFWRKVTNTPTFTNGWEHWGWTAEGWITWLGDSIDPPGVFVPQPVATVPPPVIPAPTSSPTASPVSRVPTSTPAPMLQEFAVLKKGIGGKPSTSGSASLGYAFLVQNPSLTGSADGVDYQIAVYDAAGTVLKTTSGSIWRLNPEERQWIAGDLSVEAGETIARMDVQVKPEIVRLDRPRYVFLADNASYRAPSSTYADPKVTGVIRNPQNLTATSLRVSAVVFDAGENVVGGGYTYLDFVPANGQSAVEVGVKHSGTAAKVELYAVPTSLSSLP